MNHNRILGVRSGASQPEIQKAFRAAAMEIHPDHSNEPEAAETFARIKEAKDQLLREAQAQEAIRDDAAIQNATTAAVRATGNATYSTTYSNSPVSDEPTPEELAHIQELDRLALHYGTLSVFARRHEPDDVRRHRRKITTTNRRLNGKY